MTPAPPPVPVGPGDLCAWRRTRRGQVVARGFGLVTVIDRAGVELVPITGSPSHRLRRPFADVARLVSHTQLVSGLEDELARQAPPW